MKTDGIILDIDGTLWDSTPIVAKAWNEVIAQRKDVPVRLTAKQLTGLFGRTLEVIADMIFPFLEKEDRYTLINACCDREHELLYECDDDILYPGVADTIRSLSAKVPLFIVSNCQSGYIEVLLESCGLREYVRDIECYGNTGLPKGDNIRMVVQRNHLERCFYVGDTHMDEEAAGAAGIPFVHAAYGFGRAERPVGTIESLSQLTALAKKLLD